MKRILLIAIPILVILCLVGWRMSDKKATEANAKKQSTQRKNAPTMVVLATVAPKQIEQSLEAVGSLESPFQVKLSPNVAGRIDFLEAREGDTVATGQVLARIDPSEVEGEIVQAQSQVAEAEQRLSQAKITQASNAVGINTNVSQQKASVASTSADYNSTKTNYEATVAAAHEATVDAQAKVAAASAQVQTAQAQLTLAQANLENAQAKYSREYSLYSQGFVAPQELDDAKAAVKVNQATVNAEEKMLDAAKSALNSSQAQERASAHQESIVAKKGVSDIEDSKAKLTQAQATLTSAVANRAQIPAYTENLRALQSEVDAARAGLSQAIARRSYLVVKSSIDGTVTQRLYDPGATATPGSPLLVIQYLKWLYLTSAVPVEYSQQIRIGQDVSITLDALPGQTFHAKVADINKSADPTSRQFMVRMKLNNPGGLFRPGMYAHLSTVTSLISADMAVPREAVTTDASGNSTVTTVDKDSVAHVVPVQVGVQDASSVQILSGIEARDRVVTLSYRPVKDGGKVQEGTVGGASGKGAGKGRRSAAGADGSPPPGTDAGGAATPSTEAAGTGTSAASGR